MGELLFVSRAFTAALMTNIVQGTARTLRQAGASHRRAFLSLHDGSSPGDVCVSWFRPGAKLPAAEEKQVPAHVDNERIKRVVRLNGHVVTNMMKDGVLCGSDSAPAMDGGDAELCGLWLLPAFLNHDCCPSVVCVPLDQETLACVACTSLDAGDELTDSYINLLQGCADRQAELKEQKGFDCCCRRCASEASELPAEVAAAVLQSMQDAYSVDDADEFLRRTEDIRRRVAAALLTIASSPDLRHMFRASLLVADIAAAMVYESPQCSLPDRKALCAEASWEVCQAVEQVSPLSAQHLHFAEKRYQNSALGSSRKDAFTYFFVVWLVRRAAIESILVGGPRVGQLRHLPPSDCRRLVQVFAKAQGLSMKCLDISNLEGQCSGGVEDLLEAAGVRHFGAAAKLLEFRSRPTATSTSQECRPETSGELDEYVILDEMD
ncbi:unnamed protein product [Polarella glacialis]|nr:unnamed protein product [Polarella glacialis]